MRSPQDPIPMLVRPISEAKRAYRRIDPRLAALLELDDRVFEPADPVEIEPPPPSGRGYESTRGPTKAIQRRSGPLAFLTGPRRWVGTFETMRGVPWRHASAQPTSVSAFVTAAREGELDAIAKDHNLVLRARAGRVATADVRASQLVALETDDRVVAVEWSGGARPTGTQFVSKGVLPRAAVGLAIDACEQGGSGVVIGIVDIEGIDLYHPDFVAPSGRPRVISIWDQVVPDAAEGRGAVPGRYGYGREHSLTDVFMELDPNQRERYSVVPHAPLKVSHGTLVAGVAAGGGVADPGMRGVAPGADIVFVSTRASGAGALAAMTEIAEAVSHVFDVAGDRPCVVNVSLGDDLGPKDGESPVERFFDALIDEKPGRALVIAAGNEHESGTHASATLPASGVVSALWVVAPRPSDRHAVIEIWYSRVPEGEDGISIQVVSPNGATATEVIVADGLARAFDLGETRLVIISAGQYPGSGAALIRLEMFARSPGGAMDMGDYKLLLRSASLTAYHAWIDHPWFRLRAEANGEAKPPPITLTSPATCQNAIAVGACHHESGQIASFTGRGPTRRGADKPEVYACGVTVCAPSAATADRYYRTFTGTSAAAPLVTGALALAFEHAAIHGARLSADQTKAFIRAVSAGETPGRLWLPADGKLEETFAAAGIVLTAGPTTLSTPHLTNDRTAQKKKEQEGNMSVSETKGPVGDQDLVREKDGKQIGVGFFTLIQNGIQTGRLLVVPDKGIMVEHWDLWRMFRQPSWALTRQEITFEYVGEPISVAEFMRDIGANSTYIVAKCEQIKR